jgi:hypothetical protein
MMVELLPGMEDDIRSPATTASELTTNFRSIRSGFRPRRLQTGPVILVAIKGGWRWALFTGSKILCKA